MASGGSGEGPSRRPVWATELEEESEPVRMGASRMQARAAVPERPWSEGLRRGISRSLTMWPEVYPGEEGGDTIMEESELVPSSLAPIVPILRAANEIEDENPRVAYLCRFTAFEKARTMDPNSTGRGVRQFKTYLLHRLEKDEQETQRMLASTDAREVQKFYTKYCRENLEEGLKTRKPDEMARYYQIASVLYDVLKTVMPEKSHPEFDKYAEAVEKEKASYSHYNILPLNISGRTQPVMEIPEIKAAVYLLRRIENLPKPRPDPTYVSEEINSTFVHDLLDWLWQAFGFQKGNVENQKEHLILLLANIDMRKGGNAHQVERQSHMIQTTTVEYLMEKIFENYNSWCQYLYLESNIKIPNKASTLQLELLYIGLYLLIWGEASNVRFMPECLCYIFHHMARDLYDLIFDGREDYFDPPFQREGSDDAFLQLVIQPIYRVMQKEAERSKRGTVSHSKWRNYDDLNEYFWSKKCFKRLGWPMDLAADFFADPTKTKNEVKGIAVIMASNTGASGWLRGKVKAVTSGDCLLIMGSTRAEIPPEKSITLSYLMAPRLARRGGMDEPFAWESREFLRKLCIGKEVTFRVDYTAPNVGREFGTVYLGDKNVAYSVVAAGWARVKEQGPKGEQSPYLAELQRLEEVAKQQGLGRWSKESGAAEVSIRDLPPSAIGEASGFDAKGFAVANKGKSLEAIVEQVRDGSTVRVYLLPSFQFVQIYVAGVQAPSMGRRPQNPTVVAETEGTADGATNGEDSEETPASLTTAQRLAASAISTEIPPDRFGREAKHFTETRVLNRDVRIVVEGTDSFSNIIGSVYYPDGETAKDLALELVENGFAKYVEWSANMLDVEAKIKLKNAELQAKKDQLRIWTGFKPPVTNSKPIHDQKFTGKVVEVVSGDCIIVADDAAPYGSPSAERRVNLSSIRAPKMGNPRRDEKPENFAREAKEFLRTRLIGKQVCRGAFDF